jgi:hypothetical protein
VHYRCYQLPMGLSYLLSGCNSPPPPPTVCMRNEDVYSTPGENLGGHLSPSDWEWTLNCTLTDYLTACPLRSQSQTLRLCTSRQNLNPLTFQSMITTPAPRTYRRREHGGPLRREHRGLGDGSTEDDLATGEPRTWRREHQGLGDGSTKDSATGAGREARSSPAEALGRRQAGATWRWSCQQFPLIPDYSGQILAVVGPVRDPCGTGAGLRWDWCADPAESDRNVTL